MPINLVLSSNTISAQGRGGGVKNHGEVALRNVISGHGGDGLGLNLGILELISHLNDSVIL